MKVFFGYENFRLEEGFSTVTLGRFDGVHAGHREIISLVCARRDESGGTAGLVTFDPPPEAVLGQQVEGTLLTTTGEKLEIVESLGVNWAVVIGCDEEFMQMSAGEFLDGVLLRRLRARDIVVGHDVGFGRGREGDEDFLRRRSEEDGFGLDVVEAVEAGGRVVSSTAVRAAVREGDFALAETMLGRRFSFAGEVVAGKMLGREIGFPTANVKPPAERLTVSDGVFAARVAISGQERDAVMSVGVRPTIESAGARSIEVHVFDFDGDLYGRRMEVFPVRFLRGEMKFSGLDELKARIAQDVLDAKRALSGGF